MTFLDSQTIIFTWHRTVVIRFMPAKQAGEGRKKKTDTKKKFN